MLADHARPVSYRIPEPPARQTDKPAAKQTGLYVHAPRGRDARSIDDATERFVDETRMGATP
jgi:hypothetical protein